MLVKYPAQGTDGNPVSTVGMSAAFALSDRAGNQWVFKDSSSGITNTGSGFNVLVDKTDTEHFCGRYFHEIDVTDSAGNRETAAGGVFKFLPNRVRQ